MACYSVSAEAEANLDDHWLYIARAGGSLEIATAVVDKITQRFTLIAAHPYIGRRRDDLLPGLRSFPSDNYVIVYRIDTLESISILHVFRRGQDIDHWGFLS